MSEQQQPEELDRIDLFVELRKAMKAEGGQRAFAARYGFSEGWISEVLNSKREPNDTLLGIVGLARVTRFRRIPRKIPNRPVNQERSRGG